MEALALLAFGGFVVWLIARSQSHRRLTAEAERRHELAAFDLLEGDRDASFIIDFSAMRAIHRWDVTGNYSPPHPPGMRGEDRYLFRRRDGAWDRQLAPESVVGHLGRSLAGTGLGTEDCTSIVSFLHGGGNPEVALADIKGHSVDVAKRCEDEIRKLAKGPVWEPIDDAIAAPIETAYQRYVRQG